MGNVSASFDGLLSSAADKGQFNLLFFDSITAATTAATTGSGYTTAQRFPRSVVIPTLGTGVTGALFTYIRMMGEDAETAYLCGIEYNLGNVSLATGTFTDGDAMPSLSIFGQSVQTAAILTFLVMDSTATATTPTITITYTDQDGNTGNSAAPVLPTNAAINSAFLVTPHLASGDTAIRDITNMTKSAGSAGVVSARGLLVLSIAGGAAATIGGGVNPLSVSTPMFPAPQSSRIAFYRIGNTTTNGLIAVLNAVADN